MRWAVGLGLSLIGLAACSSVGGSAVRTGPAHLPSYSGPVAIYATGKPPPNAVDLGVIEVHGAQQEASVDVLLPQFLARVAFIGGNIAVIEGTRARFDVQGRTHVEQFYYQCNLGSTCSGTRVYSTSDELMVLSMFGHAMSTLIQPPPGGPLLPPEQPDAGLPTPRDADADAGAPAPSDDGGAPPFVDTDGGPVILDPVPSPPPTTQPITPPPAAAPMGGM